MIRKLTPSGMNWMVNTIAGVPGQASGADGVGSEARFNQPAGIAVDSMGNVYVVDSGENRVTKGTVAVTGAMFSFDSGPGSLIVSNGLFQIRLSGSSGTNVIIVDVSTNLQSWTPIRTSALPANVSIPISTNANQFFRARLEP